MDFTALTIEALAALVTEKREAAAAILANKNLTTTQVDEAEALLADASGAQAEIDSRAETESRAEALRASLAASAEEPEEAAEAEVVEAAAEDDEETEEVEEVADEAPAEVPEPAPASSNVTVLARKVKRPAAPAAKKRVHITAAADVPDFGAGQDLGDIAQVAEALVSRARAFGTPKGRLDQSHPDYVPDFRFAGVAKFALDFDPDLVVDVKGTDNQDVIKRATDESRLTGGSLVAAGGWCTPSENLYDLCEGETLDGLVSLPEIQVRRGGINFTKGPDWSTLYADPDFGWFKQTEAQAEAGTEKPCFELTCPDWTDVRLDAVGLCIRVPILTNAAFPELTQRIVRGAMVAHQHKVNADVIGRMVTIAGAAIVPTVDYTATGQNLWSNLTRIAEVKRQQYMLGFNQTMEIILPFWVREAIRDDLAFQSGRDSGAVTDAEIDSNFRTRRLNPQWVADWQTLDSDTPTAGYPLTVNVLMYPAGTFVKGVSDVISLNAVYDAASLATNVYTGLFFEEGLLVANTCYDADLVTIPLCNSGRLGAANVAVCGTDAT
jgi:hypothetical protein